MDDTTYVFDADGLILGRLASKVADLLLKSARAGGEDRVVVVNAEKAIISGRPTSVLQEYHKKYELNHARKGPYFPRMPDMILKRTVRGMLPYQKKSSGRRALKALRVEIGCPNNLKGDLPEGHVRGDDSKIRRDLPTRYITLGEVSSDLGAPAHRWMGGEQ